MKVPEHIAIILDGNGRWAKAQGKPRAFGHKKGSEVVDDMCDIMAELGVKYFTVYAFSTENWSRPALEVKAIMTLFRQYLKTAIKRAARINMRTRVIGDRTGLDQDLLDLIEKATDNAKDRIDIIAKGSGASCGKLVNSNLGVFQITAANSGTSGYTYDGAFDTTSRMKTASITVKLEYELK